jgi:hypothetical protein
MPHAVYRAVKMISKNPAIDLPVANQLTAEKALATAAGRPGPLAGQASASHDPPRPALFDINTTSAE